MTRENLNVPVAPGAKVATVSVRRVESATSPVIVPPSVSLAELATWLVVVPQLFDPAVPFSVITRLETVNTLLPVPPDDEMFV